jgi:hypothetical protein
MQENITKNPYLEGVDPADAEIARVEEELGQQVVGSDEYNKLAEQVYLLKYRQLRDDISSEIRQGVGDPESESRLAGLRKELGELRQNRPETLVTAKQSLDAGDADRSTNSD